METIPRTTFHSHLSVWWARCFAVVVRGKYGISWQKEWIFSRKRAALKCRRIAAVESVLGIDRHKLAIDKFVYIRRKPSCVVHDQSAGLFKNFSHVLRLLRVILRGSQLSLSLSFSLSVLWRLPCSFAGQLTPLLRAEWLSGQQSHSSTRKRSIAANRVYRTLLQRRFGERDVF